MVILFKTTLLFYMVGVKQKEFLKMCFLKSLVSFRFN
ncbi:hypothetical protein HPIN_04605 [Helicobacter pylori India7]|uniref:Uncharacterized protein n=1 Tax=Helicobacter pylori (strain India7) TaxID=907238 RepID=E8QGM9_HELP7|nr:hypothetical protein HPIN_04605 [Helicobacter pylori India7]